MTIIEAAREMEKGKTVKRSSWVKQHIEDDMGDISMYFRGHLDNGPYMPDIESLLANDWEIVE